jgi:hypothetical protein
MSVYIFTKKQEALKPVFAKNAKFLAAAELSGHEPEDGDITYVDISGFPAAKAAKAIPAAKKACKNTPWGIIDPKGQIGDPASLFFEGASDYLGPAFVKNAKGIDAKRLKSALSWRHDLAGTAKEEVKIAKGEGSVIPKTGIKLPPASAFPGWKNMQPGKNMPFYLVYCCLQGKVPLDTRLGEKVFAQMHHRFMAHIAKHFQEGDGLAWMDSGKDCLFLFPAKGKSGEIAVKNCVKLLVSAPLIMLETLGLTLPAGFVFALHYGSLSYSPPGHTGTVVSDAVNFIFHLGAKKAQPGRLTLSGELPDGTVPKALEDSFVSAGEYEGRKIFHTKKFFYAKK